MTRGRALQPLRIAVVGGSLGGLIAAIALQRRGHTVDVYERSPQTLAGRGAGIVTHSRLMAILAALDISAGTDFGVEMVARRVYDHTGQVLAETDYPQISTSWDRLYALMRARVADGCHHASKVFADMQPTARGIVATFADGTTTEVDLLIGADGLRSTVRQRFQPDVGPTYAGYVAWRALVEEAALSPATRTALAHGMSFSLPPGEQALAYPVAGSGNALSAGQRRINLIWYRPAEEQQALAGLLTGSDGRNYVDSGGIPPPLIRQDAVKRMRADGDRLLCPAFAEVLHQCGQPILQPIFDLAVPRMTQGPVALIGDAAFVVRPHVGAGVTKAAEDATALAEAVSETIPLAAGLARFDTSRHLAGRAMVARGIALGANIGQSAAMSQKALENLMENTASLVFLES